MMMVVYVMMMVVYVMIFCYNLITSTDLGRPCATIHYCLGVSSTGFINADAEARDKNRTRRSEMHALEQDGVL